jgi:hypothetical protein
VVSGALHASEERSDLLAAYAVQADYGDYDEYRHTGAYFPLEAYYPPHTRAALPHDVLYQHVQLLHRQFVGMARVTAEREYVAIMVS